MPDLNIQGIQMYINKDENFTPREKKEFRKIVNNASPLEMLDEINKLLNIMKTTPKHERTEIFMMNILVLIRIFVSKEIVSIDENGDWTKGNYMKYKIGITQLWSEVMKWDKTKEIHKKILRLLPDKIMKCLTNPLHTSDYLISAFEFGGPLALYSLKGIFILMTTYNMEVPDFYTRLYTLFQRPIFEQKFQADFFTNVDIFLMSSHLPEKLVAAFVKKLSWMSLMAPAPSIILICTFIQNLMVRHPGLVTMVNTKSAKKIIEDPFLPNEKDPMNSRAIESCLWEIKTLQNHVLPIVSTAAKFIDKPIGKQEVSWIEYLNLTYDKMIEQEISKSCTLNAKNPDLVSGEVGLSTNRTTDIPLTSNSPDQT